MKSLNAIIISIIIVISIVPLFAENRILYLGLVFNDHTNRFDTDYDEIRNWYLKVFTSSMKDSDSMVVQSSLFQEIRGLSSTIRGSFSQSSVNYFNSLLSIFNPDYEESKYGRWLNGEINKTAYRIKTKASFNPSISKLFKNYDDFTNDTINYFAPNSKGNNLLLIYVLGHGKTDEIMKKWRIVVEANNNNIPPREFVEEVTLSLMDLVDFSGRIIRKVPNTAAFCIIDSCEFISEGMNIKDGLLTDYLDKRIVVYSSNNLRERTSSLYSFRKIDAAIKDALERSGTSSIPLISTLQLAGIPQQATDLLSPFTIDLKLYDTYTRQLAPDIEEKIIELTQYRSILSLPYFLYRKRLDDYLEGKSLRISGKYEDLSHYIKKLEDRDTFWIATRKNLVEDRKRIYAIGEFNNECMNDTLLLVAASIFHYRWPVIIILLLSSIITLVIAIRKKIIAYFQDFRYLHDYRSEQRKNQNNHLFYYSHFDDDTLMQYEHFERALGRVFPKNHIPLIFSSAIKYRNNDKIFTILHFTEAVNALRSEGMYSLLSGELHRYISCLIENVSKIIHDKDLPRHMIFAESLRKLVYELYRREVMCNNILEREFIEKVLGTSDTVSMKPPVTTSNSSESRYREIAEFVSESMYLANDDIGNFDAGKMLDYASILTDDRAPTTHTYAKMRDILEKTSIASRYYAKANEPLRSLITGHSAFHFGHAYGSPYAPDYTRRYSKLFVNMIALLPVETREAFRGEIYGQMKDLQNALLKYHRMFGDNSKYREFLVTSLSILKKGFFFMSGNLKEFKRYSKAVNYFNVLTATATKALEEKITMKIYSGNDIDVAVAAADLENLLSRYGINSAPTALKKIDLLRELLSGKGTTEHIDRLVSSAFSNVQNIFSHAHILNLALPLPDGGTVGNVLLRTLRTVNPGAASAYEYCINSSVEFIGTLKNLNKKVSGKIKIWKRQAQ